MLKGRFNFWRELLTQRHRFGTYSGTINKGVYNYDNEYRKKDAKRKSRESEMYPYGKIGRLYRKNTT